MILEGIRVLDFTQYLAGPTVTRLMAEMGAEIIKIEHAPNGDPARTLPFIKDGRSGYFVQQNRGKRSVCLDLSKPESKEILFDLVGKVDVMVENYGPGVMERRGLDYPSAKKLNPRLVMASISAFGRVSPLSHRTGYDWIAQAYAGFMHVTGPKGGKPHPVGVGMADVSSGVHAFSAIGYALFHRERTGRGQYLDISMVDALFHMHEVNVQSISLGNGWKPDRVGSNHELVAPIGVFKGPEGYIVIMALQLQWPNLCKAMMRPDLEQDPRFSQPGPRAKNQEELNPQIEAWLASFASDNAAIACLEEHRVPCAPVISPADAPKHEYFEKRGTLRTVKDPILGDFVIPGFPLRFSEQPEFPELTAPLLGQHNEQVLGELLGYSAARISALKRDGVMIEGDR
ncbi:MAG: CoA transferase [Gammaproteobacteria bacterium]|nr:CoA transferase [Gammaproteobacteria bacterium]